MQALLIVDDVASLRDIQARLVRRAGLEVHEIVQAGSLREARALLAERPEISAIVADHALADGPGTALLEEEGAPPIVLVGGSDTPPGLHASLPKPYTAAALRAALEPLRARA